MKQYDYIFAGSGLSALMTVYRMIKSGKFADKRILLLDENPKKSNDRTWCFWEKSNGDWDEIVSKFWNSALFANQDFRRDLNLNPYQYKMIRGIDFYNFVFCEISKHSNIEFIHQKVNGISETGNIVLVKTNSEEFQCNKLFNSILDVSEVRKQTNYPLLQQHFIGWFIKSEIEAFNSDRATFMDFSVEQRGNTRFMYVLPTSKTEALVEYTLFSKDLLPEKEYENEIIQYIEKLGISDFTLIDKERGNIPMTSFPFWKKNSKNIVHLGSSGGWTKASSGYTFKNSDKRSKELVAFLKNETDLSKFYTKNKFWFYDLLLVDILFRRNDVGSKIFSSLFKNGDSELIFKFLDEETSLSEDLQVIWKCPKSYFLNALWNRLTKF